MNALDALYRCRRAWEATQPQLFWTDENLWGGLAAGDRAVAEDAGKARPDDPANPTPAASPWGGLDEQDAGAVLLVEPAVAPLLTAAAGSNTCDGDGANHFRVARRPQKGA